MRRQKTQGFTLIEILTVVAIIGILSGIAIPAYLAQRRRAMIIGYGQTNVGVAHIQMETRRADFGTYGTAGQTVTWTNGVPNDANFLPNFRPQTSNMLDFKIVVGPTGLTYVVTAVDKTGQRWLEVDQAGTVLYRYK